MACELRLNKAANKTAPNKWTLFGAEGRMQGLGGGGPPGRAAGDWGLMPSPGAPPPPPSQGFWARTGPPPGRPGEAGGRGPKEPPSHPICRLPSILNPVLTSVFHGGGHRVISLRVSLQF